MNLMKTSRALAAIALATLGFAFPAEATITAFFSNTSDCLGTNTASFSPGGAVVPMSLCVTTTTEKKCGVTYNLRSAVPAEDNRFFMTTRVVGPAVTDGTADLYFDVTNPTTGFNVVPQGTTLVRPDGSGVPQPIAITNPPSTVDMGSTDGTAGVIGGFTRLMGTVTLAPQATATNASYVISLSPNANFGSANPDCASSQGNAIAASFTLTLSQAPAITSPASTTFTVGTAGSFSVTATGAPAPTFAATGTLPSGVSLSNTGSLFGTPATGTAGSYPITITASNGNLPNATQSFTLTVAKKPQTITFGPIAGQPFNASPFTITGASATSALPLAFTSSTTSVCTVTTAGVITFVTGGTCTISANQGGNVDFLAAAAVPQSFTITASAPAAPTIGAGTPGNNTATIAFTAPTNNGGSAILDFTATCTGTPTASATGPASPVTVSGLVNFSSYACSVVARNAVGTGPASATVTVTPSPGPPVFTSAAATTFTVGVAGSFTVTATNAPTFTSTALPAGVTLTSAGVLAGTPSTAGVFPVTITATGTPPAATQSFTLTISKGNQTINFGPIVNQPFNASPIALTATATSTLAVTYASSTPAVCSISGASAAFLSAGNCTITASQAGNANFNAAAPTVTQSFTVTPSAPGAPTIGLAQPANLQAYIGFTPPTVTGGSPILDYTATCTGGTGGTATGTTSPLNVIGLVNGTTYTCSVTARNVTGSGPASATATVTPAPIVPPGAPIIGSASPGNTLAIITFSAPASNGGSAITSYMASCVTGASPAITATGLGSPVTVTGLTNNSTYNCSVRATNIAGAGLPSATVSVTPRDVPITLTSTTNVAAYGAPVTLVASVTGNGQTGTVSFSVATDGGPAVLPGCAAVPLVAGTASCVAPGSFQNQNPRQYLAAYSGDAGNAPASISFSQIVAVNTAVLTVAAYPLPPIVAGRTTTLTALIKMNSPSGTVTFFDNAVPITGCTQTAIALVPDATDAAVATCTVTAPDSPSGLKQYVATYFYPAGHVSGRVFEQTNFDLRVVAQGPADYTDMWWAGAAENGWGISITQHGPIQFNVIFAYDNLGKPLWYVMPRGDFNTGGTVVSGPLYLATSSPFSAYDKSQFVIGAPVGTATITYSSNNAATLAYTINGISATKSIQREVFAAEISGPNLRVNDLWWATFAEDGWGMNIAQQGHVLFPVWYTYNAAGKATFFTAQNGSWNGTVWSGTVYTHASSAWLGVPYSPSLFTSTVVGTMSLDFSDASNATMTTTVNGVTQVKHIERQPY